MGPWAWVVAVMGGEDFGQARVVFYVLRIVGETMEIESKKCW